VTKCDLCQPRLESGFSPACVAACPTHAITVEKVRPDEWRADHATADAPGLPSADITLSTTRIALPRDVPVETFAASDWNLRPEHPHWPLVWLTLITQVALGVSATASTAGDRLLAAVLAGAGLVGALAHLGRPIVAWKALRNLRRSWLSREVALLSLYAGVAAGAVLVPGLAPVAAVAGAAGVFASARLYVVPGRPAWDTPLTVVRFFATALALGPPLTGHVGVGVAGGLLAVAATALNWARLARRPEQPWWGAMWLELRWFRPWTIARVGAVAVAAWAALAGAWPGVEFLVLGAGEVIGRWLFFVTVVPLNMPGSFWRGAAGSQR
jgi:DMSO reductase anchor subunit